MRDPWEIHEDISGEIHEDILDRLAEEIVWWASGQTFERIPEQISDLIKIIGKSLVILKGFMRKLKKKVFGEILMEFSTQLLKKN